MNQRRQLVRMVRDTEAEEDLNDTYHPGKKILIQKLQLMGICLLNRESNWKSCCRSTGMCSRVSLENQCHQAIHTHY